MTCHSDTNQSILAACLLDQCNAQMVCPAVGDVSKEAAAGRNWAGHPGLDYPPL